MPDERDPREANQPPAARAEWVPPAIVDYGSLRHLVRAATGPLTDVFNLPGMRRP
jgi:hypothetical protein